MRRAVLLALFVLTSCTTACTRLVEIAGPLRVDTLVVEKPVVVQHTDTLLVARVDTLVRTRVDTLYRLRTDTIVTVRVDTLASPPVHDTTRVTVVRVDTLTRTAHDTTIVQRTDTLYLPSQVVHDSTWVYVQGTPTNPLAGGDPTAGVAYVQAWDGYAVVFWRGHFVGVVHANNNGSWDAYVYDASTMRMPMRGTFPSLPEAVLALVPIRVGP